MKRLITNYAFNPAARTITFTDYSSISLAAVLLVTNVTDNEIIYNFAAGSKGGTVSGNVLTLSHNTAGMDASDSLQIYYDDPNYQTTDTDGNLLVSLATQLAGEDSANNAIRVEGVSKMLSGSAAATNEDLIASTEVMADGFARFSLQIIGTWSGTITVGCSNDNQNFSNAVTFNNASTNVMGAASITANGCYYGFIHYKYIRVRLSTATSGTATAILALTSAPGTAQTLGVQAAQTGIWSMHPAISGTSAVTSVAAAATSTTLLASNTNRRQAFIFNDSSANMFLKFGSAASATSYTTKLAGGSFYALPTPPIYSGIITAAWDSATGDARITEIS